MSEGFLERWSHRKQSARKGEALLPEPQPDAPLAEAPPALPVPQGPSPASEPPPPTLQDAQALTPEADFRPFMARNVEPEVKNLALRKLFADPHFNAMDGLDVYIDDYSRPAPMPESMLRQLASAAFLKLVGDDPQETPQQTSVPDVAQSAQSREISSRPTAPLQEQGEPSEQGAAASQETDDHADLRLQPDDAAGAEDPRCRPG